MNGLLHEQRQATLAAARHREHADGLTNPREAEVERLAANQEERRAADLAARIERVEAVRIECGSLAARLRQIEPSADVMLALHHVEDAESRLIRELGN
jgi:hypothetical protein